MKKGHIYFNDFNGYWKDDLRNPSLKDIHYHFKSPKLYGITGRIGTGKSGLLGAIVGELPLYSGKLIINGTIAYVEQ